MTSVAGGRRRTLWTAVCAAVLAGAALWLFWPWGDTGPAVLSNGTAHYRIRLTVDASRTGASPVTVEVADLQGRPVTLRKVTVEPVMTTMGHAYEPVDAVAAGPGRYRAESLSLRMGGAWELNVLLHGPTGVEQAAFPLLVTG
ncbi:FixH family protein [Streptosporangium sp. NPDC051023]|uniref:FixH family protein n=1 Tax=Streptosporangium sp. NPDC051023 TaxID=3155410 RepID=UPI00344F2298